MLMTSAAAKPKPVSKFPLRFLKTWGLTLAALTALSGGLSVWISTTYWGYPFTAPALPETVSEFDEILTITPFEVLDTSSPTYQLAPERLSDRNYLQPLGDSGYLGSTKCNTEYCHPSRALVQLVEQGSLTEQKHTLTAEQLAQAEDQLRNTALLLTAEGEYAEAVLWESGLIIEAMANGQRHLFFAINAGQIENDHYPYYEIVFQQDSFADPLELVEMNQFFYEIAGIEGADFRVVWILLTGVSLPLSLLFALLLGGIGKQRDRASIAKSIAALAIPAGFSPEEYLALEEAAPLRHEFRRGLVYAMAGGSDDHSRLTINLLTALNLHLRDGDCQFYSGNVKVNYAEDFYYYPDAFVTCDPRDRQDRYVKRYPKLVAEVLSPSTSEFDKNQKFQDYSLLGSLEEYVLITQDQMQVECRRRQPGQMLWETVVYAEGESVKLKSIGLEIAIADLYQGINLTP